ncbi:MAG: DUF3470 domain-containing protein [Sphingomonadales bacterium]|nr:DUF3470 domain-containing protein [Sphingomonadales bacterium]
MTYVVTDACIRCKYMDCVEVCPVDCFYEGENMLVINPSEWWPNVTRKNDQTPADADEHKGEEGKYDKYFSPEAGQGD